VVTLGQGCAASDDAESGSSDVVSADEIQITVLGTNDIHGGLEPEADAENVKAGGVGFWSGAGAAMKRGLQKKLGDSSRVVLVDAGDQAQGTLLSNFNEGDLILQVMDKIGYDAIITGYHDYDFGPRDWLVDQVTNASTDKNPRGALEHALGL